MAIAMALFFEPASASGEQDAQDRRLGGYGWNAVGLLAYHFDLIGVPSSAVVGGRGFRQVYQKGRGPDAFRWDVTQFGPMVGLTLFL